jgi:uncharacterized membrane protein
MSNALDWLIEWLILGLRWVHIVAILGWIGASLYFMWLESKLRAPSPARELVDGEAWMGHGGGFYRMEKRRVTPGNVPEPVYWFRVEAGVTWVSGFLLLVFLYYWTGGVDLVDAEGSMIGPRTAVLLALCLIAIAWFVYDGIWISRLAQGDGRMATVVSLILLFAVAYALCKLFTGRAAFIHVGSIIGTNMVANVWMRIIPAQEEAVAATAAGRERNAALGVRARRRAVHNTYMTLPVIFTMIANHAPGAYSHPLNWLILSLLIAVGIGARHVMIMIDRRQPARWAWAPVLVSLALVGYLTLPQSVHEPSAPSGTATSARVPVTVARGIVELRCASCHSQKPSDKAFPAAPNGLSFGTPQELRARADMIKTSILVTRTMPPANKTRMTDEERALLVRWVDQGARID